MIRAQPMDAVVVIGGCDKTLPAQIMAAVSADLPTVVIPVGPMVVGHHKGEVLGACTDCRRLWAKFRAGEIDEVEIEAVNGRLAPSVGTCMVMGTASTMACITEALGLSLPMSATIPAPHAERFRLAEASGRVAAAMALAKGPRPSELLTPAAFHNAQVVLQAIGGSTNGLIHLTAIANRTAHRIDLEAFDRLGREVPVLIDLKPSGRALHGAFPSCRRRAQIAGATRRSDRPRCQHHRRRDAAGNRCRRGGGAGTGRHPPAPRSDQAGGRDGGAARQSRAARRRDQAFGGDAETAAAYRARRGVRIRRRHDAAGRRSPRSTSAPTMCWCCATPVPRARRACRRPAICRSRRSSRAPASRTWCGYRTRG